MKKMIIILLISLLFDSSKSNENVGENDGKEIKELIYNFLKWYKNNYEDLMSITLVPASIDQNANNLYKVNFNKLDLYLEKLKSSGYLSNGYISNLRNYVKNCNSKMIKNSQTDGPPEGLDFDLVLATQEVDDTLAKIDQIIFNQVEINKDTAVVKIKLVYDLTFKLKKVNGKWLIDG